jgi:hypothetical protein
MFHLSILRDDGCADAYGRRKLSPQIESLSDNVRFQVRLVKADVHPIRRRTMQKTIISATGTNIDVSQAGSWLDLEKIAKVELTSEDVEHPFEHALRSDTLNGWRASTPGPQVIRLCFEYAQTIRRIRLVFREEQVDRAQEIALFVIAQNATRKELVRQQWVFSSRGSNTELEDYYFDLKGVTAIELQIDPGRHDKQVFATLESIQIG